MKKSYGLAALLETSHLRDKPEGLDAVSQAILLSDKKASSTLSDTSSWRKAPEDMPRLSESLFAAPPIPEASRIDLRLSQPLFALSEVMWWYMDLKQVVHGPFPSSQMKTWYLASYFDDDLLAKRASDPTFFRLSEMFARGDCAFLDQLPERYRVQTLSLSRAIGGLSLSSAVGVSEPVLPSLRDHSKLSRLFSSSLSESSLDNETREQAAAFVKPLSRSSSKESASSGPRLNDFEAHDGDNDALDYLLGNTRDDSFSSRSQKMLAKKDPVSITPKMKLDLSVETNASELPKASLSSIESTTLLSLESEPQSRSDFSWKQPEKKSQPLRDIIAVQTVSEAKIAIEEQAMIVSAKDLELAKGPHSSSKPEKVWGSVKSGSSLSHIMKEQKSEERKTPAAKPPMSQTVSGSSRSSSAWGAPKKPSTPTDLRSIQLQEEKRTLLQTVTASSSKSSGASGWAKIASTGISRPPTSFISSASTGPAVAPPTFVKLAKPSPGASLTPKTVASAPSSTSSAKTDSGFFWEDHEDESESTELGKSESSQSFGGPKLSRDLSVWCKQAVKKLCGNEG